MKNKTMGWRCRYRQTFVERGRECEYNVPSLKIYDWKGSEMIISEKTLGEIQGS